MPISTDRFDDVDRVIAELQRRDGWGKATCPICGNDEFPGWEALRGHLQDNTQRTFVVTPEMLPQHTDAELNVCLRDMGLAEVAEVNQVTTEPTQPMVRRGPGRPPKSEAAVA